MRRVAPIVAVAGALALSACAVAPPTGPSIAVMPSQGKDLATFQQDDFICRGFAQQQIGGASPAAAAADSQITSSVAGTVLGAAAGAAIGAAAGNPALGAAIGAGSGLIVGTGAGANAAQASAGGLQRQYDVAYAQCMTTKGDTVPAVTAGYYPYGPYYPYPYYGYYPGYYPYYGSAFVGFGFGFHRHFHHFHRR